MPIHDDDDDDPSTWTSSHGPPYDWRQTKPSPGYFHQGGLGGTLGSALTPGWGALTPGWGARLGRAAGARLGRGPMGAPFISPMRSLESSQFSRMEQVR